MKINNSLWLIASLFIGQKVNAQLSKKIAADPPAQLKQLIGPPHLSMPAIKMPAPKPLSNAPVMPGYNIKKMIDDGKQMCPFLNLKPDIVLTGDRTNDQEVGLRWKTANTLNCQAFDVERSFGDTLHFEKVNFVWAKGSTVKEKYQLPDNNDFDELSYYRIKMFSMDASFMYSNIAKVNGYDKFIFSLYPNPSANKVSIILSSKVSGPGRISITDGEGKTVQQFFSPVAEGNNQKDLNISRLPAGIYLLSVVLPGNQVRVKKFIKD